MDRTVRTRVDLDEDRGLINGTLYDAAGRDSLSTLPFVNPQQGYYDQDIVTGAQTYYPGQDYPFSEFARDGETDYFDYDSNHQIDEAEYADSRMQEFAQSRHDRSMDEYNNAVGTFYANSSNTRAYSCGKAFTGAKSKQTRIRAYHRHVAVNCALQAPWIVAFRISM